MRDGVSRSMTILVFEESRNPRRESLNAPSVAWPMPKVVDQETIRGHDLAMKEDPNEASSVTASAKDHQPYRIGTLTVDDSLNPPVMVSPFHAVNEVSEALCGWEVMYIADEPSWYEINIDLRHDECVAIVDGASRERLDERR